ncbi:inositol monophosphatase [Stanieria cyanosphaera PCC 7437]|uniref:Inositol monophosphatase n=1 Tax=Stanieria cyanosphaera (strain ATCC 29371 / PCC 7437) TaxID=111780 RepID=K9XUF2_STAC7|nr:inositol monophosphatase family protein [Stanieria cyanosphaera]AFZ36163.1 inositol monophosphatase [Stanieria cyanosphaera PCC 7437]
MASHPSPRQILKTLFPHLKVAAGYANQIQSKIKALPDKGLGNNFFSAALTDADISIQTLIEVVLLGTFPELRFHGEEYEQSRNTKYFRATDLGSSGDYLVTLDPIDGTKFYLDGHNNYQIILSILNADDFEAVIAISPAQHTYYYALRGEGTYQGNLDKDLEACTPLIINHPKPVILLGWGMSFLKPVLTQKYQVIEVENDYSTEIKIPNVNGILANEITGLAIRRGKFIDGGALSFLAREAGCIVTTLDGSSLPPLSACQDYSLPGLLIATSELVHQDLLEASQQSIRS